MLPSISLIYAMQGKCDINGCMIPRAMLFMALPAILGAASDWLLIRKTDGSQFEGQTEMSNITVQHDGKAMKLRMTEILSIHSAAPASAAESEKITADLATVQEKDRMARDRAVEELTAIGLPAMTPLLRTLKDTDQHEPRPLYRLFERIMPSHADGLDRSASMIRLSNGSAIRCALPQASVELRKANGEKTSVPWSDIRTLAVRKRMVKRAMPLHSLRHCNQIEYLDTGVTVTPQSKVDITADGFVRLSWNEDGWASDADGLKKPGSPAYKTNLVGGFPFGAVIGRSGAGGDLFLVGKKSSKTGLPVGRLELAVNDNGHWQNNLGTYSVTMTATDSYDLGDAQ